MTAVDQVNQAAPPADPTEAVEELLLSLRTHREGLSSHEAQRRLAQYGPNDLQRRGGAKWPRELERQLTHPLALLLWVAALLSFIVGSITVCVAVVLVIVLNAVVAFVQERHAEKSVEALAGYMPQKVTVKRDGDREVIDAAEAERIAGEILKANAGHAEATKLFGYALLMQARPEEAVAPLEKAARASHDPEIETQLAIALRQAGLIDPGMRLGGTFPLHIPDRTGRAKDQSA